MFRLRYNIMTLVFLNGFIKAGLPGPNRTSIEADYNITHGQFGYIIAAIQIIAAIVVLLNSNRLAKFGSIKSIILALAIQTLSFALIVSTKSPYALIIGWTGISLTAAVAMITNNISIDLWPHNPRRGVILLHTSNAFGKVVSPLVVALCLTLVTWRISFLVAGLLSVILLTAFALMSSQDKHENNKSDKDHDSHISKKILKKSLYWLTILPFALISGGEAVFATLMPVFFVHCRDMKPEHAAYLFTVHLLGLAAGRLLTAQLNQRISNNTIITIMLLTSLFIFPIVFMTNLTIVIISLFFFGVLFSATWPIFYAQIAPFYPDNARSMLAYGSGLSTTIGCSIAILISSQIADIPDIGLHLSLLFSPAILWLFAILYFTTILSHTKPIKPFDL